ncbi:MAG TPA: hypothetical protein VH083_28555 [Myxococcales bacterium]|nr:hypothetical protein [Myxococcales bacterium]
MTKRILSGTLVALAMSSCSTDNKSGALPVTSVILGTATVTINPDGSSTTACAFVATAVETEFPVFAANAANRLGAAGFVVKNQLTLPSTVNTVFNSDTTTFSPHQAVVDYEIVGGGTSIAEQIIPVSGTSVPSGTSGAVIVPLFLPAAALAAAKTMPGGGGVFRTTVRIEGELDDGSKVTTSEHEFVFTVQTATNAVSTPCF